MLHQTTQSNKTITMTPNRGLTTFTQLVIMAAFALTLIGPMHAQVTEFDSLPSGTPNFTTTSGTPIAVPGAAAGTFLTITLPAVSSTCGSKCKTEHALLFLDMPNLYLSGVPTSATLGAEIWLYVGGVAGDCTAPAVEVAFGEISNDVVAAAQGRKPITIIAQVPLTGAPQVVTACWNVVRGGTLNSGGFASLTAINVN